MHNHAAGDVLVYQYPRVQFKVLDRVAYMVGIGEGSDLLSRLWLDIDQAKIGSEELRVLESQFETNPVNIEVTETPRVYQFATPWLALNQNNFREYMQSKSPSFRREKLNRTLVGNCLGMCKSLGIRLSDRIAADCSELSSFKTSLKGQSMVGFVGNFSVNLSLPGQIGLGKSVSRGFGTIEKDER